jgi:hypothetical protein
VTEFIGWQASGGFPAGHVPVVMLPAYRTSPQYLVSHGVVGASTPMLP